MGEVTQETLGNFRLLAKLGQGGMGSVYRAVHGTLERPVALKVLPPEFSSHAEYVARFLREARTIATIKHENIIQVYDSGEANGQYFIAMELVDGGNLLNLADARKKISEEEGLGLMLQAARGLGAAHAKGLIHRDIKPENLLLGKDGMLRIVDFGLVMDSDAATQLTLAGTCLGTPMYMSPEQADGEIADPRSDLYSLGATFFRVFTGRPVFGPATTLNILFKQKFEQPADPQTVRPDLSRGACDILLHLLAKRREDRPADAQALIAMLEALRAGKPIATPPKFSPLMPRPKYETAEASVSVDGETELLFGSGRRRVSGASGDGKSYAVVAAILFVIFGAALFAIAANRKTDEAAPQALVKPLPPISDAELRERIGMGEEAFNAGRIKDARAIFLEALRLAPGNNELIRRRDLADRRIRYEAEMLAGDELEKAGKLADAARRFANAQALVDEDADAPQWTAAKKRMDRANAEIERSKGPIAELAPIEPRDNKADELARIETQAGEFLRTKDYEKAEAAFTRAAEAAGDDRKAAYLERAKQCRRMNFLTQAKAAETANDLVRAEAAYVKAQDVINDTETAAALEAVRQKMLLEEKNEARYQEAMREGQAAMERGDFAQARVKFGVAMGQKPDASPPAAKLNEVDARELLHKGDTARDAGDLAEARTLYAKGIEKSPAVKELADARIKGLEKVPSRAARAVSKACELAAAKKDEEALAALDAALKLDAGSDILKEAKDALEAARATADAYEQLQKVTTGALDSLKVAAALEDDDATKRFRVDLLRLEAENAEKAKKPLALFAAHDFAGTNAALTGARADAGELNLEITKASEHYIKQAEKTEDKTGIKVPFLPKIGVGGDRKKAEKYRGVAEGLKQLAAQAKTIQK